MKILMVCLGNICRSPLADGLLREKVKELNLDVTVDSAGTSNHHVGQAPDARMRATAREMGLSIDNLQAALEASKKQPLYRLIYGLGIRFIGETTAKTLANAVDHLLDFTTKTEADLLALEDVGVKVAKSIVDFFADAKNIELLHKLEAVGLDLKNQKKAAPVGSSLTGQTFLFTGTLPTLKRNAAEQMAADLGGVIASGVSSKLNYLVVGEDAGSKLEKAKKINTIHIISEAEFIQLIESSKK